jgi:hypothetical protein
MCAVQRWYIASQATWIQSASITGDILCRVVDSAHQAICNTCLMYSLEDMLQKQRMWCFVYSPGRCNSFIYIYTHTYKLRSVSNHRSMVSFCLWHIPVEWMIFFYGMVTIFPIVSAQVYVLCAVFSQISHYVSTQEIEHLSFIE